MLAYLQGAVPIWSPLYDWILAFPSFFLTLGSPSESMIISTAMLMNLILGLFEIVIAGALIFKAMGKIRIAILSMILISITSSQVHRTSMKNLDHNCLVLLFFLLFLLELFKLLRKDSINIYSKHGIIASIMLALLFWTWPGSYLFIAAAVSIELIYIMITKKDEFIILHHSPMAIWASSAVL